MKETKLFLEDLKYWEIELNNYWSVKTWNEVINNTTENLYFITWVKPWVNKRCSASDMLWKIYFVIDVDLRKQFLKAYPWEEVSNEDIIKEWKNMVDNLAKEDAELWKWRYIVYSWSWLHIYYKLKTPVSDEKIYSFWIKNIFKKWNNFWGDNIYYADDSCSNLARIFRLPWSTNQKSWSKCEILWSQNVLCDFDINEIWKKEIENFEQEKERELQRKIQEYEIRCKLDRLIQWNNYDINKQKTEDLFRKIDLIPAYLVSQKLKPQFPFYKNNKNFLSDEPNKWNKFTAFFYDEDKNTIHNGGSSHYNWWNAQSWYSNSVLVWHELWEDWKEVVKWFKENFHIK